MSTLSITPAESGKWRQCTATVLINVITLGGGMAMGWTSPVIAHLRSPQTSVGTEAMTEHQVSWLGSSMALGGIAILPFCSILAERFGRKKTACLSAIPLIICWLLKIFTNNFSLLLIARFLSGTSAAMSFFIVPIYVSEIAGISVRGLFGSMLIFSFRIGLVIGYILGAVLPYKLLAISGLVVPIIFIGGFLFMPETPIYLVRKGQIVQATRSLMWFKNNDKPVVDTELQRLQLLARVTLEDNKKMGLRDLFRDRGTTKGFIITLGLITGQELSGISPMLSYTAMVFEQSGSSIHPNTASIIVGSIQLIGSWLSVILMERAGRRMLLFISCLLMAFCHATIGTFMVIQSYNYDLEIVSWIPLAALSLYGVAYCIGMGPTPFVIMSEVFSADIMSYASSIVYVIGWIFSFFMMKFFPILSDTFGLHSCFLILACLCIYIFVFTYYLVPETKGRSIESIINELNNGKSRESDELYSEAATEMITKGKGSE